MVRFARLVEFVLVRDVLRSLTDFEVDLEREREREREEPQVDLYTEWIKETTQLLVLRNTMPLYISYRCVVDVVA